MFYLIIIHLRLARIIKLIKLFQLANLTVISLRIIIAKLCIFKLLLIDIFEVINNR